MIDGFERNICKTAEIETETDYQGSKQPESESIRYEEDHRHYYRPNSEDPDFSSEFKSIKNYQDKDYLRERLLKHPCKFLLFELMQTDEIELKFNLRNRTLNRYFLVIDKTFIECYQTLRYNICDNLN